MENTFTCYISTILFFHRMCVQIGLYIKLKNKIYKNKPKKCIKQNFINSEQVKLLNFGNILCIYELCEILVYL